MKKNLLLLLLVFSSLSFSQSNQNNCNFEYDLVLSNTQNDINNAQTAVVTLNWDFSKIDFKTTDVKIEIVPNLDCLNQSSVPQLKDPIFLEIDSKNFKSKDSKTFNHIDMMAKCFKYRVVINSKSCNEISEWKHYNFF